MTMRSFRCAWFALGLCGPPPKLVATKMEDVSVSRSQLKKYGLQNGMAYSKDLNSKIRL